MLSTSFLPSTPPAALISAMAASAPFFSWVPNDASAPVMGPATPTVMSCADAAPANAKPAESVRPASHVVFIHISSSCGPLFSLSPRPRRPSRKIGPRGIVSGFDRLVTGSCGRSGTVPAGHCLARLAFAPGKRPGALIKPIILGRHLGGARHPPSQRTDQQEVERIDGVRAG